MSAYRSNSETLVPIEAIRGISQSLPLIDSEKIQRFADLMKKGYDFPPIMVSKEKDGSYCVRQGHHRLMASRQCAFTHIPVDIISVS